LAATSNGRAAIAEPFRTVLRQSSKSKDCKPEGTDEAI
jgi:hypothetical protein